MSLVFKNVSYSYPDSKDYALDDVSFNVNEGDSVGVIGHTGSGKSTLMQLTNALIEPSKGEVLIDGENINKNNSSKTTARNKVSLVFQYPDYQFFADTVEKDIAFGLENRGIGKEEISDRVNKVLNKVGFEPLEILQRNPFELSGGQKRRLAIAEALVNNPSILVLDEPCAGLDPRGRAALIRLLRRLNQDGVTVLMVSHNLEEISQLSNKVIVLNVGKIFTEGSPREVFANQSELEEIGLGIPIEAKFAKWLSEGGIPMPDCVIGFDELVSSIEHAFKAGKN